MQLSKMPYAKCEQRGLTGAFPVRPYIMIVYNLKENDKPLIAQADCDLRCPYMAGLFCMLRMKYTHEKSCFVKL